MSARLQKKGSGPLAQAPLLMPSRSGRTFAGGRCQMTQNQSNAGYALLALALVASLLYRPVIAADPDASQTPAVQPGAGAISEPLQQDFDALIREIEARE